MKKTITILRHGEAEPFSDSDVNRNLTENGLLGSRSAAKALAEFVSADQRLDIFYSPFNRTKQTAFTLVKALSCFANTPEIACLPSNFLLENSAPQSVVSWLKSLDMTNIMLVSHQPLVSRLAAWLVDGVLDDSQNYHQHSFSPGSMMVIEADFIDRGCGVVSLTHHFNRN